ncbi:MAG: hypothetical protein JWM81_746 [Candidatus Saccharibacteria bacterium]|nr:hypothetical protein [Candidatus Saccharibacteria bacterium]
MSEFAPNTNEKEPQPISRAELTLPTAEQAEALRPGEKDPLDALLAKQEDVAEAARDTVEQISNEDPRERFQALQDAAQPVQQVIIDTKLSFRQTMQSVHRRQSKAVAAVSSALHNPIVSTVSDAAGKTVSRPSGLAGGGLMALLGTSGYLYMAKHYGFSYNYFVFLALFVAGFGVGLVIELLTWAAVSRRKTA